MTKPKYITLVAGQQPESDGETIIAIGRHCFIGKDDPESYLYLPTPWNSDNDIFEAASYCQSLYLDLIDKISIHLNSYHKINYPVKFYERILGYWLLDFIHQAYDKYSCIKICHKLYPEAINLIINSNDCYIPKDFTDYQYSIIDDIYSHQIYSQIISFLDLPRQESRIYSKEISSINEIKNKKYILSSFFKYFKHKLINLWNILASAFFRNNYVAVVDTRFKTVQRFCLLKLAFYLKGKIVFPQFNPLLSSPKRLKSFERNISLLPNIKCNNEFFNVIINLINLNIPCTFLEFFSLINSHPDSKYIVNSSAIYSVISQYTNPYSMCAISSSLSIPYIIHQHGGGYGISRINICEYWERRISSFYLAWGWANKKQNNLVNMPLLSNSKKRMPYNNNNHIVYVTNTASRYLCHFCTPSIYEERCQLYYLNEKIKFLKSLNHKFPLIVRTHNPNIYKWDENKRILNAYSNAEISNITYDEDLSRARIVVVDFILTSFLECLAYNIPTILFGNSIIVDGREDFMQYYIDLKRVGIIHNDANDAANFIDSIYNDTNKWWSSNEIQLARSNFVNHYAITSDNPIKSLASYLKTFLND